MTEREALKLALEALELEDMACRYEKDQTPEHITKAITAIREALAQPEQICGFDVVLDESMPPNTFKLAQPEHSPNCALLKIPSKDCDCQDQQEPVAKVVSTAPERIWLDLGFDPEVEDEISFDDLFEATWSHDNATGNGIEYVRADLAPASKPLLASDIVTMYDENPRSDSEMIAFARAIEAAHGIKE